MSDELRVAEELCSRHFGAPVRLERAARLRSSNRTRVQRCKLVDGPAGAPDSVIVKEAALPYGATFDGAIDGNIWNDWAGLEFVRALAPADAHVPRCLGGDAASGLIVLEDLGDSPTLRDLLAASDPAPATAALIDLFATLGRLHASSAGREPEFLRLRRELGAYEPAAEFYPTQHPRLLAKFQTIVQALGIVPHPQAERDLAQVIEHLQNPGPFHVYLHGDPSPANFLRFGRDSWLIDFEYGGYGPALLEASQARMLFPSGGFVARLPAPALAAVEQAYRRELGKGCPAAGDDQLFGAAMTYGCAYWAINFAVWLPFAALLERDHGWGGSGMRQRFIARAAIFAQTAAGQGRCEALGAAFLTIAAKLRRLWPEAGELEMYPAFGGASADR